MSIVGLDLGSHRFRAVELDESKGKITLLRFGTYQNPKINLESESKEELSEYSSSIKNFFKESGFTSTEVVIALPESDVFTRVIKVPQMKEKDLKTSISYEAEQYIPLPLKEVSFDFQIMDTDLLDKDKMNVLLVAAKNTILNKYVKILRNSGLVPRGMEPETLAVSRVLGDTINRPSASIIVGIGSESSEIIVSYKGFVRFTRSITVGGNALTRAIAQNLSLEFGQAEEYKITYGLDSDQVEGKVFNALKPVFDSILNEIRRSKVFYTTHNPNVIINRVILSGGTALMPGLLFYIANNLDLEVELANPWRNIQFSGPLLSQKEALIKQGPVYATAVGLALKNMRRD
jgi:type IV pilus assembly protein PilM